MSQRKAAQGKKQTHKGDAAGKARPVAPAPQQAAIAAPDLLAAPALTPAMLPLLQRSLGNQAVQRLISARPVKPAPFTLQRLVTTSTTSYKRFSQIKAMSLSDLHRYAEDQADWHKSPDIDPATERPTARTLLDFARLRGVMSGCSDMKVNDLLKAGLVDAKHAFNDAVLNPLKAYSWAVSQHVDTVEIKSPTNSVATALKWGKALEKLMASSALDGMLLKVVMPQAEFEKLLTKGYIDDFIKYCEQCQPRLEAAGGVEIRSYLALRGEGVDPVSYKGSTLDGNIRNFHRFQRVALDRLKRNFAATGIDADKRKPLTLVLHSAHDHNGAFHRDSKLTEVITYRKSLTLLIEGKETLDEIKGELGTFASTYGKGNKIDQVMFAGHGNARSIQLAGSKEQFANATKKYDTGKDRHLTFDVGDRILVGEVIHPDFAKGRIKDEEGYFRLDHTDYKGKYESVNLDRNKAKSDALFDEVLKHMANDASIAPHRRIVFNACLTNSNAVTAPLDSDPAKAQKQVRDHISANSSLATYMQDKAKSAGLSTIKVLGSNASFGEITLIDKGSGGLDLISSGDPKMTSDKLEYVRHGNEPQGALRAVLECWAGFGEATAADQAKRQADCFKAMEARVKESPGTWDRTIIKVLYEIILARYRANGEMIRQLGDASHSISSLYWEEECRVRALENLKPGQPLSSEAVNIFQGVKSHSVWSSRHYVPLVSYQVWMKHDSGQGAEFMKVLKKFNCQTAAQFLDIDFIKPDVPALLPHSAASSPAKAQLLLAFRVIDEDDGHTHTKDFLKKVVGPGNRRFPAALSVDDILKGRPSEGTVLSKIGLGSSGSSSSSSSSSGVTHTANMDLDGDGKNETYVEPLTNRTGIVINMAGTDVFDQPKSGAAKLPPSLKDGASLYLLGQIDKYYAIEYDAAPNKIAFVDKGDVLAF